MRLVLSGRTNRQPILKALANIPGIEMIEADTIDLLVAEAPLAEAIILSDPRGPDGARLAEALRHPDAKTRWAQMVSAGYAGMLAHELPAKLVVTNQGGAVAPAVAEHALALILTLNRGLPAALTAQAAGTWESTAVRGLTRTLEGATVAILGLGHVGRELAMRLKPFGATTIGVTRDGAKSAAVDRTIAMTELDPLLAQADVVALCLPDLPATRGLFDAHRIAAMKRGAFLVNVGRGELVDPDALRHALTEGHLGGAAIDVTDPEPLPSGDPLWRAPNLIITPHVAGGGSRFSGERLAKTIADNVARFMRGEPLLHQVHPKAGA